MGFGEETYKQSLLKEHLLYNLCVYVCACMSLYVIHDSDGRGSQRKALDPPELDLQVVVKRLSWVLGSKSVSSVKAASIPTHSTTFPDPQDQCKQYL